MGRSGTSMGCKKKIRKPFTFRIAIEQLGTWVVAFVWCSDVEHIVQYNWCLCHGLKGHKSPGLPFKGFL